MPKESTSNPLLSGAEEKVSTPKITPLSSLKVELEDKKNDLKKRKPKNADDQQEAQIIKALSSTIKALESKISNHPETKISKHLEILSKSVLEANFALSQQFETVPDHLLKSIDGSLESLGKIKKEIGDSVFNKMLIGLNKDPLASFELINENSVFFSPLQQSSKDFAQELANQVKNFIEARKNAISRDKQSAFLEKLLGKNIENFNEELQSFINIASLDENLEKVGEKYASINDFRNSNHCKKVEAIILKCDNKELADTVKNYLGKLEEACENTQTKESNTSFVKTVKTTVRRASHAFNPKAESAIVENTKRNSVALASPFLMSFQADPEFRLNILNKLNDSQTIDRGFFLVVFSGIAIGDSFTYNNLNESFLNESYKKFCEDLSKLKDQKSLNQQLPNYSGKKGTDPDVFVQYFDRKENLLNLRPALFDPLISASKNRSSSSSDNIENLKLDLLSANKTARGADQFVSGVITLIKQNLDIENSEVVASSGGEAPKNSTSLRNKMSLTKLFGGSKEAGGRDSN